jgi:SPP1 gp7 family putative phage head morphogenesis protein
LCELSIVVDDKTLQSYVKRIYDRSAGLVDPEIWKLNYTELTRAIQEGWGKGISEMRFDEPNWQYIAELKYHTASFAAFKNHQETGVITELLIGEDGKPRSWIDFRNEALKISEGYNKRWLQTEFNHAHQSARMAGKWKDFEENADLYPNLMFVAVMDERTREDHAALNGAIYPINDPFWDTYYPPLDWGCRCSVKQTDSGTEPAKRLIDVKPGFANNPGKTGEIFDTKGAYYKGAGAKDRDEIDRLVNGFISKQSSIEVRKWYSGINDYNLKVPNSPISFILSNSMVRTITGKTHSNRMARNELIYDIKNVIKNSKPVKGPVPDNNARLKYKEWYYYEIETGLKDKFYLNYVKRIDGSWELHAITDGLK